MGSSDGEIEEEKNLDWKGEVFPILALLILLFLLAHLSSGSTSIRENVSSSRSVTHYGFGYAPSSSDSRGGESPSESEGGFGGGSEAGGSGGEGVAVAVGE